MRSWATSFAGSLGMACLLAAGGAGAAEPWADADPPAPPARAELGELGFKGAAEYRTQALFVNPIALSDESARGVGWIDQRLRLDGAVDWQDKVRLVVSADVLDGVLWGDNGTLGASPEPNSGANVTAKNPNLAVACIGLKGGDPLLPQSYGYTLCPATPLFVRKAYGEILLPFGLLRIGRQATNDGMGVQSADGDGRTNRFGVAHTGNVTDRVLFATKPLEVLKPEAERDPSLTEGLFVGVTYDRVVTDQPSSFKDDVHQVSAGFRYLAAEHPLGRDLRLSGYYVYRFDQQFGTAIDSMGLRGMSSFGDFQAGFDAALVLGSTREVSEAYRTITSDPAVDQTVRQLGARGVVRYDKSLFTAYMEADYASGDDDPTPRSSLTQFTFAEDTNVGLLMFKHALGYQTARSSLAGVELLKRLGARSFPAEAINTRGAFSNALAVFPQFDVRPWQGWLFRAGALVAWAASPVVSPIQSLQARDGLTIKDDLVNFAGGKPGRFYGTELDARIQYRMYDHFVADLEGAVLFPGSALQDADGYAARSVLVQGRTTFYF
jgi:hypothetical protein